MIEMDLISNPPGKDHLGSNEMQYMDSALEQWRSTIRSPLWRPPTDIFETEETVVVRVEIAGMHDEDFTIKLEGRTLSIRGARPDSPARRAYHQMEIRFGEFSIEMELPIAIAAELVKANYDNGFLLVTLPKAHPLQIPVENRE